MNSCDGWKAPESKVCEGNAIRALYRGGGVGNTVGTVDDVGYGRRITESGTRGIRLIIHTPAHKFLLVHSVANNLLLWLLI